MRKLIMPLSMIYFLLLSCTNLSNIPRPLYPTGNHSGIKVVNNGDAIIEDILSHDHYVSLLVIFTNENLSFYCDDRNVIFPDDRQRERIIENEITRTKQSLLSRHMNEKFSIVDRSDLY